MIAPTMGWPKALLYAALVALGASMLFFLDYRKEEQAAARARRPKSLANVSIFDSMVAHIPVLAANEDRRYFANFVISYPLTNFRQAIMAGFAWTTIFVGKQ